MLGKASITLAGLAAVSTQTRKLQYHEVAVTSTEAMMRIED